jgi:hypothetical protein
MDIKKGGRITVERKTERNKKETESEKRKTKNEINGYGHKDRQTDKNINREGG